MLLDVPTPQEPLSKSATEVIRRHGIAPHTFYRWKAKFGGMDVNEARAQLEKLRGQAHHLHTAAALAQAGEILWSHTETARLVMRSFSDAFLDRYLARMGAKVLQTVGAYEIEGRGIQLFERVEGDSFTIIGLPLLSLLAELRARGAIEA